MGLDLAAEGGSVWWFFRAGMPRGVFRRGKGVCGGIGVVLKIQIQVPGAYDTVTTSGITGERSATDSLAGIDGGDLRTVLSGQYRQLTH